MPKHLPPELKLKVRGLYEGTVRTHEEIAAEAGVGRSTVSVWAMEGGWVRPRSAHLTPRLALAQRATAARLVRDGARKTHAAAVVGCHPRTVARIAAAGAGAYAGDGAGGFVPGPEVPAHLATLRDALTNPALRKEEAVPLITRAAAALCADALVAPDAQAERTARALANLAHCLAALPEHGPHAGAGVARHDEGPATYEETNAMLEEFALRLESFCEAEDRAEEEERERTARLSAFAPQDEVQAP
jgi:hypothetical protein